jgi:hypothetical protein
MTIELADATTYTTTKKYDSIFLDHFADSLPENQWDLKVKDIQQIAHNVPNHNLIWGWSIEHVYLSQKFNFTMDQLYHHPIDLREFDLYSKWLEFVEVDIGLTTFPILSKEKIIEYIYTYFNYIVLKPFRDLLN